MSKIQKPRRLHKAAEGVDPQALGTLGIISLHVSDEMSVVCLGASQGDNISTSLS